MQSVYSLSVTHTLHTIHSVRTSHCAVGPLSVNISHCTLCPFSARNSHCTLCSLSVSTHIVHFVHCLSVSHTVHSLHSLSVPEPSAWEGAWFEASFPSLSLPVQGYWLLIGHHGKVKGMRGFPRFLLWKRFLSRSLLFLLLFGSYRLGFNSPNLLLPEAVARSSFSSCLFQEAPTETSGHVQKVKGFVLILVFPIHIFVFLEHASRRLRSVASDRD